VKVTVLGSGSGGNATVIESGGGRILVDAGFSARDIERRLAQVDIAAGSLEGIVITHDHGDHTRGMGVLSRRHGIPLYLTPVTHRACARLLRGDEPVREYRSEEPFRIGGLEIRPFLTAHDAADPIAVTVTEVGTGLRFGIATDLGRPTTSVRAALAGCDVLVLEANHDDALLWRGPYPWSVKQRIASSHGHLSNRAAAELARELWHSGLGAVVLAHLSEHCNDGALAAEVVGLGLERCGYRGTLEVAPQDRPLAPIDVAAARRTVLPQQLALL
jgi:phosphoribosyl 1,2-cyclic phosphodiesterase